MKTIKTVLMSLVTLIIAFLAWVYYANYYPSPVEQAALVCPADAPFYDASQPLKVLVYNVQYFAGKNYVFYYDLPDGVGPDKRPSPQSIQTTLDGIAELIDDLQPDVVLLQEVNDGAENTDYHDQTELLLSQLEKSHFPCYTDAFYWRSKFVPHPDIMGAVGMKLVTLSRFQLQNATRLQLPQIPMDPLTRQFYLKRAILQADLPTQQGGSITVLNTHLDAFAQGSDTMQQQVAIVHDLLTELDQRNQPWMIGGDFNLLAPGHLSRLPEVQQSYYVEPTELNVLLDRWAMIPSLEQMNTAPEQWYTHYPNDPRASGPDRTIDYLFYSSHWMIEDAEVLNEGPALTLSDHMPIQINMRLKSTD